ncbi:MAG: hypothetical protein U5N85_00700, partial [Arcicella sp.]|nr:hypothetical protein [Arcicella sp.]
GAWFVNGTDKGAEDNAFTHRIAAVKCFSRVKSVNGCIFTPLHNVSQCEKSAWMQTYLRFAKHTAKGTLINISSRCCVVINVIDRGIWHVGFAICLPVVGNE